MQITLIFFGGLLLVILIYFGINMITMSLNDFIEKKVLKKFLWLWLPFKALSMLSKEYQQQRKKK